MKKIGIFILLLFWGHYALKAQLFVEKGDLKIGLEVIKENRVLPVDSLCKGFDPITHVPIDLITPEGSTVTFNYDSMKVENMALLINEKQPKYYQRNSKPEGGFLFSRSSSEGAENSFGFVDETTNDTLMISWRVEYSPLQLINLCPAEEFTEFIAFQIKNLFESYPDSARYDWSSAEYITALNDRGIPINPSFPSEDNGLSFVVDKVTEDAVVQLKGYHSEPQAISKKNPYRLFLYKDLAPGYYEFVVKPYAEQGNLMELSS